MVELPLIQTLEKIEAHPEIAELIHAAARLEQEALAGEGLSRWYAVGGPQITSEGFTAFYDFPVEIRDRHPETGELVRPHELSLKKFAFRFGRSAMTMSILHTPTQPPLASVGKKRLAAYPHVSFTLGFNPNPEQRPFSKEYVRGATDESRDPLPPREALYHSVYAFDEFHRPSSDPGRESGIREFSELFFSIPSQAGLYDVARLRRLQRPQTESESSEASLSSAS
jgi:hypothetical protein